jgi:hypothetical protein
MGAGNSNEIIVVVTGTQLGAEFHLSVGTVAAIPTSTMEMVA